MHILFLPLLQQDCDSQYLDTDPSDPWTIENIHLLSQYLHCIQVALTKTLHLFDVDRL